MKRKFEIKTLRLNLCLPSTDEAEATLRYFSDNKDHLRPTDPILPKDFHSKEYWVKRLAQNNDEFERNQSVRFFIERKDNPDEFIGLINLTQIARGPFQAGLNEGACEAVPEVFRSSSS